MIVRGDASAVVGAPPSSIVTRPLTLARPSARGKFLFAGDRKLYIRGVTYGAFRPDERKREYEEVAQIDRDFGVQSRTGSRQAATRRARDETHNCILG